MNIKETYHQLIRGNMALCLFAKCVSMDKQLWTGILLKNERGLVKIEKSISDVDDLSEVLESFGKNFPVLLGIDGTGVLHKQMEYKNDQDMDMLQSILPNAKVDDFYLQKVNFDGSRWASVIRKSMLESILNQLDDLGVRTIALHLGMFHVVNILEMANLQNNHLTIGGVTYAFGANSIQSIKVGQQEDYAPFEQFDGKDTSPILFAAHSVALLYFTGFNELENDFSEKIIANQEDFSYSQLFRGGVKISLAVFLVALLCNFFLFDHYSSKFNELSEHASYNTMQIKKLESLKEEYNRKDIFFTSGNYGNTTAISYYSDRIAKVIPNTILLQKMSVNPVQKITSKNQHAGYRSNIIHIVGQTGKEKSLNTWIADLQELSWIKEVVIVDYIYKGSNKPAKFKLDITVKDEFKTQS